MNAATRSETAEQYLGTTHQMPKEAILGLQLTIQPLPSRGHRHAEAADRNCFISSETNIIASIIVYPPRSILEICLCTYFQLLVHCSITNSKRIQLLSAICDFSPILKFNADHKFGRIYMYCLLFGKTSVQDSEIQKYSMLHT